MPIRIEQIELKFIKELRATFLQELSAQFVCNKCHLYGWADTYLFTYGEQQIGYGSVWGTDKRTDRDTIFEFYLLQPFRKLTSQVFEEFCSFSKVRQIESQTNDPHLLPMLYEFSESIVAEAILFEDHYTTELSIPGAVLKKVDMAKDENPDDVQFELLWNDEIVATGGLMLNYNFPYADIYMGVKIPQKGFGSLIVQELKREAYQIGRVPSARCNIENRISKATLIKAGLKICGYRLKGQIRPLLKAK